MLGEVSSFLFDGLTFTNLHLNSTQFYNKTNKMLIGFGEQFMEFCVRYLLIVALRSSTQIIFCHFIRLFKFLQKIWQIDKHEK